MRSPLAYPLNRSADMDVGGAADLQTDVMRFMAIISLCLVAIFALVQAMPMTPPADPEPVVEVEPPVTVVALQPEPAPVSAPSPEPVEEPVEAQPRPAETPVKKPVVLTRPKWTPKPMPAKQSVQASEAPVALPETKTLVAEVAKPESTPLEDPVESDVDDKEFTLRFASDIALTRLVAGNQVGLYAIDEQRARRMTVSESHISFWDASTPNSFHEMDEGTVPDTVITALSRTGVNVATVSWGVTLPGKLKGQLDGLMQEHGSGSLVIESNGTILWEASQ